MTRLPESFVRSGYKCECEIPEIKYSIKKLDNRDFSFIASFDQDEVTSFIKNTANDMSEKLDKAVLDELATLNGYVLERTCKVIEELYDEALDMYFFRLSCGAVVKSLTRTTLGRNTAPNYCQHCGAKVINNAN